MGRHVIVAGAGIVGLATAAELSRRGDRVTVLEKEDRIAAHQTGRNSGVIHSGLYYPPGSLKARLGTAGAASMRDFAAEHGVPVDICGKLVIATREDQRPALMKLYERGQANGVPVRLVDPAEAAELEPYVRCVAALHVASTGIVDYRAVCDVLVRQLTERGGELRLGSSVTAIRSEGAGVVVGTNAAGELRADEFVNCAGLQSDRLARLAGLEPDVRIVPFRGEYFELAADQEHRVRGLIYPVPDPTLPFLGVHLTRMIHGGVHAGPNAVLALAREGYRWRTIRPRDVADYLRWPGLWQLGRRFWRTGGGRSAAIDVPGQIPGQPARAGALAARRLPGPGTGRRAGAGTASRRVAGRGLPVRPRSAPDPRPERPVPGGHGVARDRSRDRR